MQTQCLFNTGEYANTIENNELKTCYISMKSLYDEKEWYLRKELVLDNLVRASQIILFMHA